VTVANATTVARIEDTNSAVAFAHAGSWIEGYSDGRPWSGGTAAIGFAAGQRATLGFTGTRIDWLGLRGPQTGIANVYLDEVLSATIDAYSPSEQTSAVLFSAGSLTPGPHTLVIDIPNPRVKNNASTDYFVVVDAFDVTVGPAPFTTRMEETDPAVTYAGRWTYGNTARAWSGGTAAVATRPNALATATFNFSGTGVRVIGLKAPITGLANVYLDGVFMTTIDTYSATEHVGAALFTATGLAAGAHTLIVEATGTKNPQATYSLVFIDAFDVQ
jgi:hypothetical protein